MKQPIAMLVASLLASAAFAAPQSGPEADSRNSDPVPPQVGVLTAEEIEAEGVAGQAGAKGEKDKARAAAMAGKKQAGTPAENTESRSGSGGAASY